MEGEEARGVRISRRRGGWALVLALALVPAAPAGAATIRPTTTADRFGEDGTHCALREAVQAANTDAAFGGCAAGSGGDVLSLEAETYRLTRAGDDSTNELGDLDIEGVLTISHTGLGHAVIDGSGGHDRLLHSEGATNSLTLSGLNLTG